ncbi:unnamed protein product [Adineta ricciae]|uniref:Autophagy-related protein 27 n=1 Tax=Adineta ricciae TaxID=249248 RepID=A0A815ZRQ7_ADIRI|nr:unnamed protein product [Adineta ricciae]
MVVLSNIVIFMSLVQIIHSLDSCRQTFGKHKYDLNRLNHLVLSGDGGEFRYVLTPCGLVPTDKCGKSGTPFTQGMMACQERIATSSFESAMGFLDGYGKTPNLEFVENSQGPGTGVLMTVRNALCNGRERLVKITFVCDESQKNPSTMVVVEGPTCQFAITVKAADACPVQGRISGGIIFIIVLLVVIIVYIIGGVSYNRFVKKQTGLGILPHPGFWLLTVGLFTTGCKFCVNFILSCGRGTSSAPGSKYESV